MPNNKKPPIDLQQLWNPTYMYNRVFLKGHFVKKNVHPTTQLVSTQEDHIQKERLNKQV